MPPASSAIAVCGLSAATTAIELLLYLVFSDNLQGPQAALLGGGAAELLLLLAAIVPFFAAVTVIYIRVRNGGGEGAGAAVANGRILEVAIFILSASIGLVELLPFFDQLGAMGGAQAALLYGAAVEVVLPMAALVAFFTAVMHIYVHFQNGGGGVGIGNRPIPGTVAFVLCVSVGLLELLLFPQPGATAADEDGAKAPRQLGEAAARMLLPAATVTFFLSISLIYVHIRALAGGGGDDAAENDPIPADLGILAKATLAATLVTLVLSFIAVFLRSTTSQFTSSG